MRSLTRGNYRAAATRLRQHKGRSLLTMLGIIIGVSSVITVVSIGQGIKQQISDTIDHTGKNLITVRPGRAASSGISTINSLASVTYSGSLTEKDYLTIKTAKGIDSAAPLGIVPGTVKGENGVYGDGPVVMTTQDLTKIVNQTVAYGVFLTEDDDNANFAVLGSHAAEKLFDANVPLGQTFTFRGQDFMVRGIMNEAAMAPLSSDINFNNAIFVSYATGKDLTKSDAGLYEVLAKPVDKNPTSAANQIQQRLNRLHGDTHDFTVLLSSQTQAQANYVLNLLTQLIAGVAAVSLLVGGIGIMNVMLVSVAERMHEIGIRKAIGATSRQIRSEFMAEATVLSVVGSLIGIVLAVAINILLRIFTSLQPTFDWRVMLFATLVSVFVGIVFGTAPAAKAARKDAIEALRGE